MKRLRFAYKETNVGFVEIDAHNEEEARFRTALKEQICKTLTDIYLHLNDGLLPNWEDDEEIYVEADEIGLHLKTEVEVSNTYDDSRYKDDWSISAYVVTLDENLFFHCEDNELEWTEISTDELVGILDKLQRVKK